MSYYPLFLRLAGVKVLLAGAGEVGRRKAADLLKCGPAELLWLDPVVSFEELAQSPEFDQPEFADGLAACPGLVYERRAAQPDDVIGRGLVFTATSSRRANNMLAETCARLNIFCNVVDAPSSGNFLVPAHFSNGDILFAICTQGQSPALARRLRIELQNWVGSRYAPLLTVLGRLRTLVLGFEAFTETDSARRDRAVSASSIFRCLVYSELDVVLVDGDLERARAILLKCLPEALHDCIEDVLYEPF